MKVKVPVAKKENNDAVCECYLDTCIWEQGQGHLLTIDISSSTQ